MHRILHRIFNGFEKGQSITYGYTLSYYEKHFICRRGVSVMQVLLKFNKEQERLLKGLGLRDGKSVKRYLIEKVKEDTKQSVIIAMLKELLNHMTELNKQQREMFLSLLSRVEALEEIVKERVNTETGPSGKVVDIVYEMLKLFILNYTQLYQSNVKQKVLEQMERLRDEV